MPARVTYSPGGIPLESLVLKLGFSEPKHEVVLVFLIVIGLNTLSYTNLKIVLVERGIFFAYGR